jgi:hypothetical protein
MVRKRSQANVVVMVRKMKAALIVQLDDTLHTYIQYLYIFLIFFLP